MTTICGPCSRIRDGRNPETPAVWRWWTHNGRYFNDLCESCAGWWILDCAQGCSADEDDPYFRVELVPDVMVT